MIKKRNLISGIFLNAKFLAFLGLTIIILISFPIAKNVSQRHKVGDEVRGLEEEIRLSKDKNARLKKLINYLNSDQYVEEQARMNFGMKKPGERAVVVDLPRGAIASAGTDIGGVSSLGGTDMARPRKTVGNPEKWWRYFWGEHNNLR